MHYILDLEHNIQQSQIFSTKKNCNESGNQRIVFTECVTAP